MVFVGDDGTAKSSTVPGASERLLADMGMPVLYPADPQQILDLGVHAAAMSRASGLWVALKISTDVADGSETVDVSTDRVFPVGSARAVDHRVTAKLLPGTLAPLERSRDGERRRRRSTMRRATVWTSSPPTVTATGSGSLLLARHSFTFVRRCDG